MRFSRDPREEFVRWCCSFIWDGCDIDGGDAQDKLIELGLLVPSRNGYDPSKHGPADCDPGDPWYTLDFELWGRGFVDRLARMERILALIEKKKPTDRDWNKFPYRVTNWPEFIKAMEALDA